MAEYKKNNRWYIDYYLPNGKRKREVVTIQGVDPAQINRQDAKKALSIRIAEMAQGKFQIESTKKQIRFEQLVKEYLKWADENHKSPKRDYIACKHLLREFSANKINDISLWHIEKYKSKRKADNRKPETINRELSILRRMYNLAIEWKLITISPIKGMKLLKAEKFNPRVIKDWEFKKLYESAIEHFKPILLCAYMTGMRRGEIAKLKWVNVDLKGKYIHVVETKNNESRSIPIAEQLLFALKGLKDKSESENVFNTQEGKPYTNESYWNKAWITTLRISGIDKCRFHDLRHTFTSRLIVDEKEDYVTVMALTGHKDISMLLRYSHTREEAKRSAINKISDLNYL